MHKLALILFIAGLLLMTAIGTDDDTTIVIRLCGLALVAIAAVILRIEDKD